MSSLRVLKSPSQQFGNLFNAYAKAINKAYDRTGSLFENPFGRVPVTSDSHLVYLVTYIHQNPQKHGFVTDFRAWPYSSYHAVTSKQPTRLERDEVLAWFQGAAALEDAHRQMVSDAQMAFLSPDDFD
jgi:putative transposase